MRSKILGAGLDNLDDLDCGRLFRARIAEAFSLLRTLSYDLD
jgi:hypothetical protein